MTCSVQFSIPGIPNGAKERHPCNQASGHLGPHTCNHGYKSWGGADLDEEKRLALRDLAIRSQQEQS